MTKLAVIAFAFVAACGGGGGGDSIVAVDRNDAGRSFALDVGQLLDVKLWNCLPGYDAPSLSSDAVEYCG